MKKIQKTYFHLLILTERLERRIRFRRSMICPSLPQEHSPGVFTMKQNLLLILNNSGILFKK